MTARRITLAVALVVGSWMRADAAQSFAYVATCESTTSCAAPSLLVYDANTTQIVTKITLPAGRPVGTALSPSGERLYISMYAESGGRLVVIDATTHQSLGSYPAPVATPYQDLTVSRDGLRVFLSAWPGPTVYVFDVPTHTVTPFVTDVGLVYAIAASPTRDRLYVATVFTGTPGTKAYDTKTGALVAGGSCPSNCSLDAIFVAVSPDGNRVYEKIVDAPGTVCGPIRTLDPETLLDTAPTQGCVGFVRAMSEAESGTRLYSGWGGTIRGGNGEIQVSSHINGLDLSRDERHGWVTSQVLPGSGANVVSVFDLDTNGTVASLVMSAEPSPVSTTPRYAHRPAGTQWTRPTARGRSRVERPPSRSRRRARGTRRATRRGRGSIRAPGWAPPPSR